MWLVTDQDKEKHSEQHEWLRTCDEGSRTRSTYETMGVCQKSMV